MSLTNFRGCQVILASLYSDDICTNLSAITSMAITKSSPIKRKFFLPDQDLNCGTLLVFYKLATLSQINEQCLAYTFAFLHGPCLHP